MSDKPHVIHYFKRIVSPVLFGGDVVSRSKHYSLNVPAMLAEALFYMDCAEWVMYANYHAILIAWNESTITDELPFQPFMQQAIGKISNPNF